MDIKQIKSKAVPILKEAGVIRSSLFGSYARGEAREDSDIDMLIEFPKGKSLLDLVHLERAAKDPWQKSRLTYLQFCESPPKSLYR